LRPLLHKSEEFRILQTYASRSIDREGASSEVVDIYRLSRKGEAERFAEFGDLHRTLLWHGSGIVNFAGILSQGLRIAPAEADISGYMFGKGIYFADMLSKSLGYCSAYQDPHSYGHQQQTLVADEFAKLSCLLLCEVALGKSKGYEHAQHMEKAEDNFQSTKGLGTFGPDYSKSLVTRDGVHIPLGPIIDNTIDPITQKPIPGLKLALNYNEFIVYKESQVKMRYLVQVGPIGSRRRLRKFLKMQMLSQAKTQATVSSGKTATTEQTDSINFSGSQQW